MILYLDSSALVKLVAEERESAALRGAVEGGSELVSSGLARVELRRAAMRKSALVLSAAEAVLMRLALVPLDGSVLDLAGALEPASLRSLDAVHLASAQLIGDRVDRFITYDRRLGEAAKLAGLPVASPGPD